MTRNQPPPGEPERWERRTATFRPQRTDDLRDGPPEIGATVVVEYWRDGAEEETGFDGERLWWCAEPTGLWAPESDWDFTDSVLIREGLTFDDRVSLSLTKIMKRDRALLQRLAKGD